MLSNLITSTQATELSGIFSQHFPLFSTDSNNFITIIKAPVQQINNSGADVLPGYGGDTFNVTDITYNPPVTGVYPAIIIYPHQLNSSQFGQLKFNIDDNQIMVKLEENAKNFILEGKVERIVINDQVYNPELTFKIQSFLGLKYYYFKLTSTK